MINNNLLVTRLLAEILTQSHKFHDYGNGLTTENLNSSWGVVKNGQFFIFVSAMSAISNDLCVDPKLLCLVLRDLGWGNEYLRPGPCLNPIRGGWVPINSAQLGEGGRS